MSVTALWQQVTVDAWRERLMPIERWNYPQSTKMLTRLYPRQHFDETITSVVKTQYEATIRFRGPNILFSQ